MQGQGVIIGVSGFICSGKSTLARMLTKLDSGIDVVSFRKFFSHEMRRIRIPISRETMDNFAEEYRKVHSENAVFEGLWKLASKTNIVVVDGIRTPFAVSWFLNIAGYKYIGIHLYAPLHMRECRLAVRRDDISAEKLRRYDTLLEASGLAKVSSSASRQINNSGTISELRSIATELYRQILDGEV